MFCTGVSGLIFDCSTQASASYIIRVLKRG
jgi:hypothetical protein